MTEPTTEAFRATEPAVNQPLESITPPVDRRFPREFATGRHRHYRPDDEPPRRSGSAVEPGRVNGAASRFKPGDRSSLASSIAPNDVNHEPNRGANDNRPFAWRELHPLGISRVAIEPSIPLRGAASKQEEAESAEGG